MKDKFYTIDQIAELLGMHHKTIRKFISEGTLAASKVGKQWRISRHDLDAFMEKNNVKVNNEEAEEELRIEYTNVEEGVKSTLQRINVSTVVDINEVHKDEYLRISNTIIAIANCKGEEIGKSTTNVIYDEKDKRLRLILWGSVKFIENMLSVITALIEQKDK